MPEAKSSVLSPAELREVACYVAGGAAKTWRSLPPSKRTWERAFAYVRACGLTPVGHTGSKLFVTSKERCGGQPAIRLGVRRARK